MGYKPSGSPQSSVWWVREKEVIVNNWAFLALEEPFGLVRERFLEMSVKATREVDSMASREKLMEVDLVASHKKLMETDWMASREGLMEVEKLLQIQ